MNKKEVIEYFGSQEKTAEFMDIKQSSVSGWPEDLTERLKDRIIGRMKRLGKRIPKEWLTKPEKAA